MNIFRYLKYYEYDNVRKHIHINSSLGGIQFVIENEGELSIIYVNIVEPGQKFKKSNVGWFKFTAKLKSFTNLHEIIAIIKNDSSTDRKLISIIDACQKSYIDAHRLRQTYYEAIIDLNISSKYKEK